MNIKTMDKSKKIILYSICGTLLVTFIFYYMLTKNLDMWDNEIIGYTIFGVFEYMVMLVAMKDKLRDKEFVRNFIIVYLLSLVLTGITMNTRQQTPLQPVFWIPVLFTLFTDYKLGVISSVTAAGIGFFTNYDFSEMFIICIMMGIIGCVLIPYITDYKLIIISAAAYVIMVISAAIIVEFIYNEEIYKEVMNVVWINTVINLVIIIAVRAVYVYNSPGRLLKRKIARLTDSSSDLINELKDFSMPLFLHGEEVGELAYTAAKAIGADAEIAGCAGLYHEAGRIKGSKDIINSTIEYAVENDFPDELIKVIREYSVKGEFPSSREAALVMLSDTVITTQEYMMRNKKPFTYDKLIESIFMQRLMKGMLDKSGLTLCEFNKVMACFKEKYKQKYK